LNDLHALCHGFGASDGSPAKFHNEGWHNQILYFPNR